MPFGARLPLKQINVADWEALENAGCIFLPNMKNTSYTDGTYYWDEGSTGLYSFYWSSTANNSAQAKTWNYFSLRLYASSDNSRCIGVSVRLVQDL